MALTTYEDRRFVELVTMAAVDLAKMGGMRVGLGLVGLLRQIRVAAVAVQADAHRCRSVGEEARMAVDTVGALFAVPAIQVFGACPGLEV